MMHMPPPQTPRGQRLRGAIFAHAISPPFVCTVAGARGLAVLAAAILCLAVLARAQRGVMRPGEGGGGDTDTPLERGATLSRSTTAQ